MRSTVRLLILIALALVFATGATCQKRQGPAIVPVAGQHTTTVERVYVAIEPHLTTPCEVKTGPLREVISVARQRRACLELLNAQLAEIAAVQGTKVEPRGSD